MPGPAHAVAASRVHTGEEFIDETAVLIEDGVVWELLGPAALPRDVPCLRLPPGTILAPGFVDLQVNGGGGVLLNDAVGVEAMRVIAEAHRALGTTALLPTLISGSRAQMAAALRAAEDGVAAVPGVLGLHLEGPFLNPARRGIHPLASMLEMTDADLNLLARRRPFPLLLTLAPERVPEAAIRRLAAAGVIVFAGHTDATAEQAASGLTAGVSGFTHLFNAMSQLASRAPGAVGAALASAGARAGIIADGLHVHPAAIAAAHASLGPSRLFLVSDAMSTVGSDATGFTLGGARIRLLDGRLTSEDGTLAGAHLSMADAVRVAATRTGIPLEAALRMATATPADTLGLRHVGRLVPGARADMVALTDALHVTGVWAGGALLSREAAPAGTGPVA